MYSKDMKYKQAFDRAYGFLENIDFTTMSSEDIESIESIISKTKRIFNAYHRENPTKFLLPQRLIYACEKIYVSSDSLGLDTNEKKGYYLVSVVDPDLVLLSRRSEEKVRKYCGFYDERLINLEEKYNNTFDIIDDNQKTR